MLSEDRIYVLVKTPAIRRGRLEYERQLYKYHDSQGKVSVSTCSVWWNCSMPRICLLYTRTRSRRQTHRLDTGGGGIQTGLYGGVCNEHPWSTLCTYAHHNIDTLGHVTQWITQYNLFSPSPELLACLEGIGAIGPCCENLHTALSYKEGFLKLGTSLSVDSRCRPGILPML